MTGHKEGEVQGMETTFDRVRPLSARDLGKIHSKTMDLLCNVGIFFESERARNVFASHGLKVDGQRVHFNEKVVEWAIASAPSKFTMISRNPARNIEIGGDSFIFQPTAGPPFIMDYDGTQRDPSTTDFQNFLKLVQSLEVIDLNRGAVSPRDIPPADVPYYTLLYSLEFTDKPVLAARTFGADMMAIACGVSLETVREAPRHGQTYGLGNINPFSPLGFTAQQSDMLIDGCERGMGMLIAGMPAAGMSSPVTLEGTLLTQNAENLSGIVLAQLVYPGIPVVYGVIASVTDMRTGAVLIGAPEQVVLQSGAAQIARYYGLPSRGNAGLTDAYCLDFQAGAEAALHYYNAVRCGVNVIPGAGAMGNWFHASLEKTVMDAEIIGYLKRIHRPLEFNEDSLAVDVIKEVGPRGSYITEPHTMKHFRTEFYDPKVFQRTVYDKWVAGGKKEAKDLAHDRVLKILADYQKPPMDPAVARDLERYVEQHKTVK
jgi:trimethylamine--corrinoid protein Co-methyltransferase